MSLVRYCNLVCYVIDGGSSSANSCPNPCQNGGSCVGKKCVCRPGYSGEACEDGSSIFIYLNVDLTNNLNIPDSVL